MSILREDNPLRRIHQHGDQQIRSLPRQFHHFKDSYDDMNFTGPFLSTNTARPLIIHGDRDEFFPVNIPVEMNRSIPQSALWIIPNGGHVPIHSPKVPFLATAQEFLGLKKSQGLKDGLSRLETGAPGGRKHAGEPPASLPFSMVPRPGG